MQENGLKFEPTGSTRFHKHCGTNSFRVTPHNNLTESYTQFLAKTQPYLSFYDSETQIQTLYYYNTKCAVLIHWWLVYSILLLC